MSIASYLISKIATWRNPLGAEENWIPSYRALRPANVEERYSPSWKVLCSRCGFAAAEVVAVIETVVYAIFFCSTIPVSWIGIQAPRSFFGAKLDSSKFAILWALFLVTHADRYSFTNLATNENTARYRCGASSCRLLKYG